VLRTRLAKIWRGELSLYEAAYALGGLSALFGSLVGDYFLDLPARHGDLLAWLCFAVAAIAELVFALLCTVATWRARHGSDGRRYGPVAIGLALAFVWVQLAFTTGWIGWSAMAGMGLTSPPIDMMANDLLPPEWRAILGR
jgi:hypothetical protein